MKPYFYFYIIRMVTEASFNYGVDPNALPEAIPWDVRSCQVQCDSIWGRVPQLNVPWAKAFVRTDCACGFNTKELHSYESQTCVQRYFWYPLLQKKKLAERIIKARFGRKSSREQFEIFKQSYKKVYSSKEEEYKRFKIFEKNLVVIEKLMATATGDLVYGMGPYTDRTSEEFQAGLHFNEVEESSGESTNLETRMLSLRSRNNSSGIRRAYSQPPAPTPNGPNGPKPPPFGYPPGFEPPGYVPPPPRSNSVPKNCKYLSPFFVGKYPEGSPLLDWRIPAEFYPEVESQSLPGCLCGSCWAFAAAAAVEIFFARVAGEITPLSKQALLDCIPGDGCKGGKIANALDYIKKSGLPTSNAYPYRAKKEPCRSDVQPYAKITDFVRLTDDIESHVRWLQISPITTNMIAPVEFQVSIYP
ncbi:cathepsin L-like [Bemisia tabaci]|uniref:cathepsin L-like n=1 Tax=Bemisia tabaci TaxID=7038 RepID=UPI003B27BBEA